MIISVMNQKGGCGKTTIAVNLAAILKKAGFNTIVMDADPQLSASRW
ncbi:MAG TPA: ParA family protein, partial [Magnetococcales bacterium]|nr:ParA family protein [Magnetococcales bacterium]